MNAELIFSSDRNRAGSCTTLTRRRRRNSAVRRRTDLNLVVRSPRNGGATAEDEHGRECPDALQHAYPPPTSFRMRCLALGDPPLALPLGATGSKRVFFPCPALQRSP